MKARLASRHRSEPLKNGIWHYVQYVERFTLIAMSSRKRVIEKERWENMYDAAASFFLRFKGERVDYVSVSHFLKQLPRDCGYRALKISFNTTEHGAAALHFDDFHEKKIAKLVGADPNCAMLACKPY
ncbi:hypothetical protein Y032_0497g2500 [Ancylostoma ceylanicum]|uniref:Uncharacterized protein n=1 Tax=Ancylostoma ceylanicum TaxID=53326 RepID=A0A016WWA7_9BILA|nr:hypothetical protein Y032_0497g2500 [Ancylostoma ceylanicum]